MIPYLGNKSILSKFILPHCPKNPDFWIEPFGGSMGLFFTLNLSEYPDTQFIYNDINPLNSNLFEQLKMDKFRKRVINTNVTESLFLESYLKLEHRFKEERALAWLIILSCGQSKDLMSKKYRGNAGFEVVKYKLPEYINHLDRLKVFNLDYKKIFQKYANRPNVFFYCDPIYKGYEDYYLHHNFNSDSHAELRDILSNVESSWGLSYYDFPEMKEWYKDCKILSKKHNISEEFLITNLIQIQ